MSRKYAHGDRIPSEVLCKRLEELSDAVTKGTASVEREFTMRIPAELDRDPDLVLSAAAERIKDLEWCNRNDDLTKKFRIWYENGGKEDLAKSMDRADKAVKELRKAMEPDWSKIHEPMTI